jgi:hypothetical protein
MQADEQKGGRKKQSGKQKATHLLNFHHEKRESKPASRPKRTVQHRKNNVAEQPAGKQQFVLANFKLVLNQHSKRTCWSSADDPVAWDDIEQVGFPASAPVTCPICLCEPDVPQMSQCGHTFCWTCILRYLEGSVVKRCPMCQEMITACQLRPVQIVVEPACKPNDVVEFTLLRVQKGATTPKPFDPASKLVTDSQLPCIASPLAGMSRVCVADAQWTLALLDEQVAALRSIAAEADDESIPFVQEALSLATRRQVTLLSASPASASTHVQPDEGSSVPQVRALILRIHISADAIPSHVFVQVLTLHQCTVGTKVRLVSDFDHFVEAMASVREVCAVQSDVQYLGQAATVEKTDADGTVKVKFLHINDDTKWVVPATLHAFEQILGQAPIQRASKPSRQLQPTQRHSQLPTSQAGIDAQRDGYFFYCPLQGKGAPCNVFLHPFCVRCLLHSAGGNYTLLPERISGSICEVERVVLTAEVRKRHLHLSHLPLQTEVTFCELDVTGMLSPDTRQQFKSELAQRSNRRRKNAAKEKKSAASAALDKAQFGDECSLQQKERIAERLAREFAMPAVAAEDEASFPSLPAPAGSAPSCRAPPDDQSWGKAGASVAAEEEANFPSLPGQEGISISAPSWGKAGASGGPPVAVGGSQGKGKGKRKKGKTVLLSFG